MLTAWRDSCLSSRKNMFNTGGQFMRTLELNEGYLASWHQTLVAIRERHFAKRLIKRLLRSYRVVNSRSLELAGKQLYREVLLHTKHIDPSSVDHILWQAENSVDDWTAPGREGLGFRELVHFLIHTKYDDRGRNGSIVSFASLVNTLVPAHL